MLPRRAFLKLLPAAGFGAKAVTAEAALSLAPLAGSVASAPTTDKFDPQPECCVRMDPWKDYWRTLERIDKSRQMSMRDMRSIPENIRSKRSWSPAFKVMVFTQQENEIEKLRIAMQDDKGLAKKVWELLEGKA